MINSMTGFGAASLKEGETSARVELKSVNHRFFDLSLNIPRPFTYLEDKIRKTVRSYVKRGAVTLFLTIDGSDAVAPSVGTNWQIVNQYLDAAREIQRRCGGKEWDFSNVLLLPGVFSVQEAGGMSAREIEPLVLQAVNQACTQLAGMRQREGGQLDEDLRKKADFIKKQISELEEFAPRVRETYEKRLRQYVSDFLGNRYSIDEERLMNEIAVFADKSAVDEELIRMKSHLTQFRTLLDESLPVGRQLDFLIQEMNREMNTIGSKGNSAGMSRRVVSIKNEIEKLREQIQNVE
ncbi:YicC/YloC family endoribonuclease [Sporolactobacillus putidus]|uniref:YicC family protein n=1 Tax=Sporolactobacillus putidus TaxID=492735 RepID=A0A917VZX5_9BACL|nr:YicC/YloC family endoribonuclease [Sporolactobacillus putidus]GGL44403.1 hypothetical protein GCM10007968_05590 [Sporolactobacillus putidus]